MKLTAVFVLALAPIALGALLTSCGGNPATADCTVVLHPGATAQTDAAHAFVSAHDGDVICFDQGSYTFTDELDLSAAHVTVRGVGQGDMRPVLDFGMAGTTAAQAFLVAETATDFTMKDLVIRNSHGDGVKVNNVVGVTFRGVKVDWTDASGAEVSMTSNGAYALYPVGCTKVLIEQCEIVGAADAGLYVGQSDQIVVRDNLVHGNVAGLEIENSTNAEVYGNDAFNNTAGILVFDLPGMMKENGMTTRVHDNHSHGNNLENFARRGSTVSNVPDGTGFMILASNSTELDHNNIEQNNTTAILLVSYQTLEALTMMPTTDTVYDKNLDGVYVHDNTYTMNGTMPSTGSAAVVVVTTSITPTQSFLEDIVWDGTTRMSPTTDQRICIQEPATVTFRNIDALNLMTSMLHMTTDRTALDCMHAHQTAITWAGLPADPGHTP